jgi:hypothetical protein
MEQKIALNLLAEVSSGSLPDILTLMFFILDSAV